MNVTLIRAGRLIPSFDPATPINFLTHGAIAVEGRRVIGIGPFTKLERQFPQASVLGGSHHLPIPGLVNAHHHGYGIGGFNLGRRDGALEVWVPDPLRRRPVDLSLDTLYSDMRLLRSGVTTVLHQGYARGGLPSASAHRFTLEAHRQAGLRVAYAVGHQDSNPLLYGDTDAFLNELPDDAAKCIRPWRPISSVRPRPLE